MYQVKVYNRTYTTLKKTISPKDIISDFQFSMNIGGGLGEIDIELNYKINDETFGIGDIVKVVVYNENNKQGLNLYMGYITKIKRKQTTTKQTLSLGCLGLASLLTEQNTSISMGANCGQTIKSLIDSYNSSYGVVFNYIMGTTIYDGPAQSGGVSGKYLECMNTIADMAQYNLFIDGNGTVRFKPKETSTTHYITNKKDIEDIEIEEDLEGVINTATFQDNDFNTSTYSDANSVSLYGVKSYSGKCGCSSQSYLDAYTMSYVLERLAPKKQATVVVNRGYNIESIKPGDTVKIKNFEYVFSNIRIEKIQYSADRATLYLDRYVSFGESIVK